MLDYNISLSGKTVLVTGAAGFIGNNLVKRLLRDVQGIRVVGIDSMNDYYDVNIKRQRLTEIEALATPSTAAPSAAENRVNAASGAELGGASVATAAAGSAVRPASKWRFVEGNIADKSLVDKLFAEEQPAVVVNLAAQAGVRYSITNPGAYIESNLVGFYNILEACRNSYAMSEHGGQHWPLRTAAIAESGYCGVEHLIYASSSSVYGSNVKVPYSTDDKVDNPVSLYAATKKSNELMAHAYSKLYNIPSTGLRFFTVYGPAGRPDMAYFGFTDKLRAGKKIQIFNYGNCKRDFTYIDDIVEGVFRVMQHAPEKATGEDGLPVPPYKVYNIGNSNPENLLDFVTILQEELIGAGVLPADYDFESHKELVPMQPGDVPVTYADCGPLEEDFGFRPSTPLRDGLRAFARWYAEFYKMRQP